MLTELFFKFPGGKKSRGYSLMVEHLPGLHKALGLILSTFKKFKNENVL
jgi:hypothetical protein